MTISSGFVLNVAIEFNVSEMPAYPCKFSAIHFSLEEHQVNVSNMISYHPACSKEMI